MAVREWSAFVEITHGLSEDRAQALLGRVLERLESHAAAGAAGAGSLDVQMSVEADSPETAFAKALQTFVNALRLAGGPKRPEIVGVEIEMPERLEARLTRQTQVDLVGISEIAALLGVTRQRASQIAQTRDFPVPLARLASGPVWNRASLTWFIEAWMREPRRPGPKPGSRHARPRRGRSARGAREAVHPS